MASPFPLPDAKARKEKLEQVAAFSLFGNVMSMASVQLVGASRDALLLSFKDAKVRPSEMSLSGLKRDGVESPLIYFFCLLSHQLSVVEYDPGTHDLKTLSLHYFEEPELRVCAAETRTRQTCEKASRNVDACT